MTDKQVVRYTKLVKKLSELISANVENDAEIKAIMQEIEVLRKTVDEEHEKRGDVGCEYER